MNSIYLDYNATTPVAPEVAEAMHQYLGQHFGNPSSTHGYGVIAKTAIELSRHEIAKLLGCTTDEIVFTSGGTESNNYAIRGVALANRARGNHIITSAIEHPAVLQVCHYLETQGFDVSYLPVDKYGMVKVSDVEDAITPKTILITIMHANNEVGTIEPISEIGILARKHNLIIHTDAAQSSGKISARVDDLNIDLLSVAGHKLYAPKGVGALYIRSGIRLEKLIHGADHEKNRRAGTENVAGIVGLGVACRLALETSEQEHLRQKSLRERLFQKISERIPEVGLNGHPEKRLPNTLSISFPGLEANTLLKKIPEIAASAGAACHSGTTKLSHVLAAMGVDGRYAMGTVRLSIGKMTTTEEVETAAELLASAVKQLGQKRKMKHIQTE